MKRLLFFFLVYAVPFFVQGQTLVGANQIRKRVPLLGDSINALYINYDSLAVGITFYRIVGIDSLYLQVGNTVYPVKDSTDGGGSGAPVYPLNQIPFGDGSTAGGITSGNFTFDGTSFQIWSGGSSSGWGQIQQGIKSSGSEAGIGINNIGTGGLEYNIISTSSSSALGAGIFSIGNATSGTNLLMFDGSNNFYLPQISSAHGTKAVRVDPSTGLLTYADTTTSCPYCFDSTQYVPYTGATSSVNLGSYNLDAQNIKVAGGTGLGVNLEVNGTIDADYYHSLYYGTVIDDNGNGAFQSLRLPSQRDSTIAIFDAGDSIVSADTATYPNLKELSYVKGVTSGIQSQFTSQQDSLNSRIPFSDTTSLIETQHQASLLLPISDTASMLNPYLRTADSALYATLYQNSLKVNISDTSTMLTHYLRSSTAASTYMPLNDSTLYATYYQVGLRVKYSDTASMLSPYQRIGGLGSMAYSDSSRWLHKSDSAIYASVYQNSLKQNTISVTTPITLSGASIGIVNQGTTTQVLHGNASGNASFSAVGLTTDVTGLLPIANGGTNASTALNARDNLGTHTTLDALQSNGSQVKSTPIGCPINNVTVAGNLSNQTVFCVMLEEMAGGTVVTGAIWYQSTVGSYTANNLNGIYLDSIINGTAYAVDSIQDANCWSTGSSNTWRKEAFTSTHTIGSNTSYDLRFIYCRSAETTAPGIGLAPARLNAAVQTVDMTNSTKIYSTLTGQTTITHTQAFSGLTGSTAFVVMGLY